jgi:hypothetical protein
MDNKDADNRQPGQIYRAQFLKVWQKLLLWQTQ